ncbi:MAG: DUF1670 domain-containing protein, partial [Thermoflexales bacterium]|nr:DUF1670 domain-containing protein [Thermoflexales bacterium]
PEILAGLGEAYYDLGDLERAADLLQQAWECASVSIDRDQIPVLYARLARLNLGAGRVGQALDQARAGLQMAQDIHQPWCKGVLHRLVGEAIGLSGGEQAEREAPDHFEASVRILRELKAEAELARSLAAYGLYVGAGAPAGAAMLDEARRLFQRLGMAGDTSRLGADLRLSRQARLPHLFAPTGRPLRDDEYVIVTWTPAAPEDEQFPTPSARRQHRLLRLLREAAAQSAAPTLADLAAALGTVERTVKRDLAALRAAGHGVPTRGSRARPAGK